MKIFFNAFLFFISTMSFAERVYLATYSEMIASNNNKSPFSAKIAPVPGAPNIDLVAPKIDGVINSPTPIKLRFEAKSPSTIKPETFKIFYGSFQIDVTERLLGNARVESNGFNVQEAVLPKGNHKLTLNIQDSDGRVGQKTVEFEVK